MIVPMKKLFLVVQRKDMDSALESLREAGSVHIEHSQRPFGSQLIVLREDIKDINKILTALSEQKVSAEQEELGENWNAKVDEIVEAINRVDQLQERIAKRRRRINFWEPWGNFSPDDIWELARRGIHIKLCEINLKEKHQVPEGVYFEKIFSGAGVDRCVAFSDKKFGLPYDEISLPKVSLKQLKTDQTKDEENLEKAKQTIEEAVKYRDSLQNLLVDVEQDLTFQEAREGMVSQDKLVYLKGYCPADQEKILKERAKKESWALAISNPTEKDNVPTLLRNPKWVELIKPVFNIVDILPGYKEIDISVVFLFFFSLFFGILIGDAAYGVVFLIGTILAHSKLKDKVESQTPFILLYVLCSCAITWGVLTGTYFGQEWLPNMIQPLLPWLNDTYNIQLLCFLIGAIHLSIAHIWRAILKAPSAVFLAEVGWLALVWGMFYAARMFVLGDELPVVAKLLFIIGPIGVIFFTKPNINPLKAIGPGISDFLLNVINTFTDVVSYIRLFAVGLATVAVADAFNTMALGIGFDNIFVGLITALILLVGHIFNMILAGIAILVHGLRLNVLEFSGHLNMEWSGYRYVPFKKIKKV